MSGRQDGKVSKFAEFHTVGDEVGVVDNVNEVDKLVEAAEVGKIG